MAGIYIHIPFCKKACHYCDFHFSTQLKKKDSLLHALHQEMELRRDTFGKTPLETLYFGGGTPSILSPEEIAGLIETAGKHFTFSDNPEITLEVNPDDVSPEKVQAWASGSVNRLSLGIQSFYDEDLKFMNRAHTAREAKRSLEMVRREFENVTIDLIYGFPQLSLDKWLSNLETALSFEIPHISAYALTVEPRTALHSFIKKGKVPGLDEQLTEAHFELLTAKLEEAGFVHYEISNFGKPGYFSRNNTAYWTGLPYLGIGPSAHSFTGSARSWNVANNTKYIKAITDKKLPMTLEELSDKDRYNEYIMTGLRTIWGVSISKIASLFGESYRQYFLTKVSPFLESQKLSLAGDIVTASQSGKFLVDGIAADLFMVD
ncbi:MAG: radical SAM family heme chaperone HemW [Eudoraea sp.]|nr:radical SAM family heme chaperone HemW [Eudoraea sp.]NNK29337.1 radical SAM family heme chaperone HemW [Flavobacteriaceae bacterium]